MGPLVPTAAGPGYVQQKSWWQSPNLFSTQYFLLWAGYWLNQSNIATNKICFRYLLQGYLHSFFQKIRNQRASIMDLILHGIWENMLGNFSVKESDLSWLSSVSPLVLLELLTKLNSKWHICNGNHLCPDTLVNYGSSLGITGCSKGVQWQTQPPSVLRFVDPSALSCDWEQFQPRRSQENIYASLAGNSASASLPVVDSKFKTSAHLPVFGTSHQRCSLLSSPAELIWVC